MTSPDQPEDTRRVTRRNINTRRSEDARLRTQWTFVDAVVQFAVSSNFSEKQGHRGNADPGQGRQRVFDLPPNLILRTENAAVTKVGCTCVVAGSNQTLWFYHQLCYWSQTGCHQSACVNSSWRRLEMVADSSQSERRNKSSFQPRWGSALCVLPSLF